MALTHHGGMSHRWYCSLVQKQALMAQAGRRAVWLQSLASQQDCFKGRFLSVIPHRDCPAGLLGALGRRQ